MKQTIIFILLSLCLTSCVSRKSMVSSTVTHKTSVESDTLVATASKDSARVVYVADTLRESNDVRVTQTQQIMDTVLIVEHADGTRDVYRAHHVTNTNDRQTNTERDARHLQSDTTQVKNDLSLYESRSKDNDSTSVRQDEKETVKERFSFFGIFDWIMVFAGVCCTIFMLYRHFNP